LALCTAAIAQEILTNDSIEIMAMARLGDAVIVSMNQNQAGHYGVTPETLIALKGEGISHPQDTAEKRGLGILECASATGNLKRS
jgi:hypothetical protein